MNETKKKTAAAVPVRACKEEAQEPKYYFQQGFGSAGTPSSKPDSQEPKNLLADWKPKT